MDEDLLNMLDFHELVDEECIGRVNVNEEVNKMCVEYLTQARHYIENKKLKTCEGFINGIIHELKNEPFEYLILTTTKIYCNLRLHNYRSVSADLNKIGNLDNNVNYKFDNFPSKYKRKKGNMIPFILKLMNCYYPFTLNLFFTSFDRLYLMIENYEKGLKICIEKVGNIGSTENGDIDDSNQVQIYRNAYIKRRDTFFNHIVLTCYILCDLLLKKDYIQQAIELLQRKILTYNPQHINTISLIGKFSLLMGCFDSAEHSFNLVECLSEGNHGHIKTNDNFFSLFLEDYSVALQEILTVGPFFKNEKGEYKEKEDEGRPVSNYAIYCNNLAVTYFYNADLKSSIQILENSIGENVLNTFPSATKNLNYFYELSKTKPETSSRINEFIKMHLSEEQEVQVLIPRRN